jgi:hypothetical protein
VPTMGVIGATGKGRPAMTEIKAEPIWQRVISSMGRSYCAVPSFPLSAPVDGWDLLAGSPGPTSEASGEKVALRLVPNIDDSSSTTGHSPELVGRSVVGNVIAALVGLGVLVGGIFWVVSQASAPPAPRPAPPAVIRPAATTMIVP